MPEHMIVRLLQKAVTGDGPGEISGLASVYGNVDLQDDVMENGALAKSASEFSPKSKIPLLDWHGDSLSRLIGSVRELKSTPAGLWFRAAFSAAPEAQSARQKAAEGHLSGVSIGYLPVKQSFRTIGGKAVRVLHEVRLLEISLTPVPANPMAQVASVKAADSALALAKGAVSPHQTATVSIPWDKGPNMVRLKDGQERTWARAFAWYDGSAPDPNGDGLPDRKSDYKFPHHEVAADGSVGAANLNGVRDAIARLPQAHIPDGDRAGVERHLRAHLPQRASLDLGQARIVLSLQNEAACKAALDVLLADAGYQHADDDAAGTADGQPTADAAAPDGGTAETPADDPAAYALGIITPPGPRDGAPGGEPPKALAGPLAQLEVDRAAIDMDRLEAEIQEGRS